MALQFSKYEPVQFGDLKVMPEVNPEKRLRLQSLKITEDNLDEARELLANCFGNYKATIYAFMENNLFLRDYFELRTYLLEGERGLEAYRKQVDRMLDSKVDEVLANISTAEVSEVDNNA